MAPQRTRRDAAIAIGDPVTSPIGAPARTVDAVEFYDPLAVDYDAEFDAAHRRVYDDLAWEAVCTRLPDVAATVVDAGCGTGRLAIRLLERGDRVIGVEPCHAMADRAALRLGDERFALHRCGIETAELPHGTADLVMAMGSVQFTSDPAAAIARMARWLRPGGHLVVLCDSLVGLVSELMRRGDTSQALERAATARARWERDGLAVEHHLADRGTLAAAFEAAGLVDTSVVGLLVAFTLWGRDEWTAAYAADPSAVVDIERELATRPALADSGKQLLAVGRRPD